ncbi:MAG: EAL domain-containing protein [Selenomonas sp.]|uniref:EAL domain-containing protein n=1 Tax=Selenomonas sp. TaxID=2053611 RepID=UPI0025FBA8E9|nr:EAL domain-containing protein [Selenomonas sp.]MCI6099305.1 EAL domain-containing protein [Selenomonas sp.]MCI6232104.1 EAL domain-containing protein [Selenomonas sp.]
MRRWNRWLLPVLFVCCLAMQLAAFAPSADARSMLRVGVHTLGDTGMAQEATERVQDGAKSFYSRETDYMQAIANYAGMEVTFVPDSWEGCRTRLMEGTVDVVLGVLPGGPDMQGLSFSRLPIGWQRTPEGAPPLPNAPDYHVHPLYFAVRQGNEVLLHKLDVAADRLGENRPGFLTTLEQVYAEHGRRFGLRLTPEEQSYLQLHPVIPIVASVDNRTTDRVLRQRYDDDQIRIYPTVVDCLRAVENGEADVTFLRQEAAQYNIYQGDFPDLVTDGTVAFSLEMASGVREDVPMELLTVLDKEIAYLGPETITNVAARHDKRMENERSLRSVFYSYPQYFMIGAVVTLVLIFLFVVHYILSRCAHISEMQSLLDEDRATNRPNRSWFLREADALVAVLPDEAPELSVVVIGVQRTDIFISTYGRDTLISFLQHLADVLSAEDWVRRVATHGSVGEVVFLAKTESIAALKGHLHETFKRYEFATVGGMLVRVPLTAGISPIAGKTPEGISLIKAAEALARADFAMHEAKDVLAYDDKMLAEAHLTSRMESLQEAALGREEFEIWYQPKYDLVTKRCIGAEALVRWRSEELGFLPPGKFIALFESNGFISNLDFYNLEHVMQFQRDCRAKGLPVVPISVNQSRIHMQEQGYLRKMSALTRQYTTDGIELELTETAFDFASAEQREHSIAVVAALHGLGFRIDMDDFGSGYSDLSLLNYLSLDVMKIDRSLLLASEGSDRMRAVLKKMVELGHMLGMEVICEGIETEAQEDLLMDCGCEYGQGYLYGRPMPRKEFEEFLKEHA